MFRRATIHLPDDLKFALESEALRRPSSEAEVIRAAISSAVQRPRPRPALLNAEPFADEVDEALDGFGER